MYLMIFFSRQIMSLFYGRKDSTWQILCSKERNELERLREKRFFDQLCKDGKLKVGGVAVFREKGRNPHPFSHCCFRSLFFSGTFSLFFIEKKLLPLVYGFGLILKSVFSSISSPAPPSTGFFLLFPSLSFFFFWYQKLLVLIPKVFPYKK